MTVALSAALLMMFCVAAPPRWRRRRRELWLVPVAALGYLVLQGLAGVVCEGRSVPG